MIKLFESDVTTEPSKRITFQVNTKESSNILFNVKLHTMFISKAMDNFINVLLLRFEEKHIIHIKQACHSFKNEKSGITVLNWLECNSLLEVPCYSSNEQRSFEVTI